MLRIIGPFLVIAVIVGIGCAAGPPPQPITEGPPMPGEQTAREAGESATEKRAEEESVIYASSRPEEKEQPVPTEDEPFDGQEEIIDKPAVEEEQRLNNDEQERVPAKANDDETKEHLNSEEQGDEDIDQENEDSSNDGDNREEIPEEE